MKCFGNLNLGLENVQKIRINSFDISSLDLVIADCIALLPKLDTLIFSETGLKISKSTIDYLTSLKYLASLTLGHCEYTEDIFTASQEIFKRLELLVIKNEFLLSNEKIKDITGNQKLMIMRLFS